jgi:hypothetical protein
VGNTNHGLGEAPRWGVWPNCGVRAGVDGGLETWMPLVADVLWIQCGVSSLTGVWKAGRDELVMCGLIAVEGLARTMVWKNWSGRVVDVWMHCGRSGSDGGLES